MKYGQLINIGGALQNEANLENLSLSREPVVQNLINDFKIFYEKKYGVTLSAIEDIAINISYLYFGMCYKHIKPAIEDKSSRYKISSLMELIIVQKQVLIYPGGSPEKNREINALFGISTAFSLLDCMIEDVSKEFFCNTNNAAVNAKLHQLIDDHQLWLETKPLNDMPIFINAQYYELIEMVLGLPLQVHAF